MRSDLLLEDNTWIITQLDIFDISFGEFSLLGL